MNEPPISHTDLKELFEWLDRPNPPPCEHGYKETLQFLNSRGLQIDPTLKWLQDNGGYCDCEIIYNVTDQWGGIVGFQPSE
jgi:Protein of unknown function (DUF2695)